MPQSYSRSFIKDNAVVIAGHILVYMKGIILMPIIIKTVGVTIYGGFVLLSSVLGIVFGISSFGAGFRTRRFLPATKGMQARRELFYPQFLFGLFSILFFSILLVLLDRQINFYIFKNEINYSTLIIPLYLVSYILYSQGSDYFRYTSRVHYMTAAGLCFPYIHIGLILLFFYCYRYININVLVMSQTLSALLIATPCFWIIFREIGVKFSFYNLKGLVSDIKLGFPLVLGFIVDFILAGSDRYFIAFYMTVSAVGYYNPGYVLGSLIIFIPKAMGTALPQLMSKAVDSKNEYEAQRMLNYALKIFLLLAIPFIFGSMVLGKPILTLLANSEVAENAYLITPIVALGTLFYGLNIILSNVLFVRMKTAAMFKMNLFASVFNLLANLILLYFFRNIIVAAITTFLSYFIAFIYINKIVKVDWPVDFQPVVIIKSVIASLFMVALLFWVSSKVGGGNSVAMLGGELTLGIIVYFGVLMALATFSKKEMQFVKSCVWR
jgi:O-antigen/teichoic acid export membrane protein